MHLGNKTMLGLLLALGSLQFLFAMMLAEGMAPGYSMHDDAISDLGTFRETELLFNSSIILLGVVNVAAGYMVFKLYGSRLVMTLFAVAGLGAIGVGLVPLDVSEGTHGLLALTTFLFVNLEVIFSSKLVKDPLKSISIILGLVGIAFIVMMFLVDSETINPGAIGHGSTERLIAFPPLLWLLIFGGYQLASAQSEQSDLRFSETG